MRAWELNREILRTAVARIVSEEEQTWADSLAADHSDFDRVKLMWFDDVPGSGAPDRMILCAVSSAANRGYDVAECEQLIYRGLASSDRIELTRITSLILRALNSARQIEGHPYLRYKSYHNFEELAVEVAFPARKMPRVSELFDKIYRGWVAQIVGGAFGTAVEGYSTEVIRRAFGEVHGYV
jgi:hypothetical protein